MVYNKEQSLDLWPRLTLFYFVFARLAPYRLPNAARTVPRIFIGVVAGQPLLTFWAKLCESFYALVDRSKYFHLFWLLSG